MNLLSIIVLIAALYEVQAGSKQNCGPVLVDVLKSVCVNGFNRLMVKKSVPVHNGLDSIDIYNNIEDDNPFHSEISFLDDLLGSDPVNSLAKTRRRRNFLGVYEECCVKGCSYDELLSYCL